MTIVIKTQNGNAIIAPKNLYASGCHVYNVIADSNNDLLGTYSTSERALEVVDDFLNKVSSYTNVCVYRMPKE